MTRHDDTIGVPDDQDTITDETFMSLLEALPSTYRRPSVPLIVYQGILNKWNIWFEKMHPDWAEQVADPLARFWKWWSDAGENVRGFQNVCVTRGDGTPGHSLSMSAIAKLNALPRWEQSREVKEHLYRSRIMEAVIQNPSHDGLIRDNLPEEEEDLS